MSSSIESDRAPLPQGSVEPQLDQAEAICAIRGSRLTKLRRRVLELILQTGRPSSAYDLLDRLRPEHRGAAPPTVYRALDFLLEQGLIHKVERLSAYVGCVHIHQQAEAADHGSERHSAHFLICVRCGQVVEIDGLMIDRAIDEAVAAIDFRPHSSMVEVEGLCANCAGRDRPAPPRAT